MKTHEIAYSTILGDFGRFINNDLNKEAGYQFVSEDDEGVKERWGKTQEYNRRQLKGTTLISFRTTTIQISPNPKDLGPQGTQIVNVRILEPLSELAHLNPVAWNAYKQSGYDIMSIRKGVEVNAITGTNGKVISSVAYPINN